MKRALLGAALALLVLGAPGWAAPVSVTVTSTRGAAPEGTVLIFDRQDATPPATHETTSIDQVNRRFTPRISVIRTGTSVRFPNSDNVRHQVYSFSAPKTFTLKLYSGQPSDPIVFDKPGLVILGCNIHDSMVGFVGVVDTPYFGKADAGGLLSLNLPPGHYRLRVWHPSLTAPVPAQDLNVPDAGLQLRVPISLDPAATSVAAWPE